MKSLHIINIGYPKCGTTWCWNLLTQQAWFDHPREKENRDLILGKKTVDQYVDEYLKYKITANFDPLMHGIDRYMIYLLQKIETISISVILRNPYEIFWSLYNYYPEFRTKFTFQEFTKNLCSNGWSARPDLILKRWRDFFPLDRIKVFFYEDLKSNPSEFFVDYCSKMNLPTPVLNDLQKVNVSTFQNDNNKITTDLVKEINSNIDRLQEFVDRDISHWKQNI